MPFDLTVYELDTLLRVALKAGINQYLNLDGILDEYDLEDFDHKLKDCLDKAETAVLELVDNNFKYPSDYTLPAPEPLENQDVHTEHCCGKHKHCKYGNETEGRFNYAGLCTVANGQKAPSYPCNCDWM